MLEKYISILRPEVLELFKEDSSGHDITHLERTMNTALFIQKYEKGDRVIVGISAFLHDIHRIMQNQSGKFVSPKDSLSKVKEILSLTDLSEEKIEKILHCIEFHEEYNWNNPLNKENDINTLILQDADNLDAIGAIGIGRTFVYGGAHGVAMYDNSVGLEMSEDYSEENGNDESTIHHFYHKLFKLGANMNTNTAKKIAERKTDFMKEFVNEFLTEWNVDYQL
ncbi:MAG: HD domain-containing protein [Clostridia bacterium]|nr:HD domain-containing protein [Clostridia bacterium]MDD4387337.1 HD domain-containing protein [Clostridia bacterium]